MISKDNTHTFSIVIGAKDYDDLRDWAFAHGKTPAEFAAQIIAARIEANMDVIEKLRLRSATPASEP